MLILKILLYLVVSAGLLILSFLLGVVYTAITSRAINVVFVNDSSMPVTFGYEIEYATGDNQKFNASVLGGADKNIRLSVNGEGEIKYFIINRNEKMEVAEYITIGLPSRLLSQPIYKLIYDGTNLNGSFN